MNQNLVQSTLFDALSDTDKKVIEQILDKTHLNWGLIKEGLVSETLFLPTPNAGIFRSDNSEWLGTPSKKYVPYTNHELVSTLHIASQAVNLEVTKGGSLYGGKRVYLQMPLSDEYVGNSQIKRYITAVNFHNGLGSLTFGSTDEVITEVNGVLQKTTFFKTFDDFTKFRHSSNINEQIKQAVEKLFSSIKEDKKMIDNFNLMAKTKITDPLLKEIMMQCYGLEPNSSLSNLTPSKLKKTEQLGQTIEQQVELQEGTVWGLFNGVLKNTSNQVPKKGTELDYVMGGTGFQNNMKAYNTIMDFLNKM